MTKKISKKAYIESFDLDGILKLVEGGFSLNQAIDILENRSNKSIFNCLKTRLENGEEVASVFKDYLNEKYRSNFIAFSKFLSFNKALSLTINLYKQNKIIKDKYLKTIVYPMSMFILVFVGIYFFNLVCFPILINLLGSFNVNVKGYKYIYTSLNLICNIFMLILLVGLTLIFYFTRKKTIIKGYMGLCKVFTSNIVKTLVCDEFIQFFLECSRVGCSTRQALHILKSINNKVIIAYIANDLDYKLNMGESLLTCFDSYLIDKSLLKMITLASYSSNIDEMLEAYLETNKVKLGLFIKRITSILKLSTYVVVGIIVVFVYQILLLPLSILSKL